VPNYAYVKKGFGICATDVVFTSLVTDAFEAGGGDLVEGNVYDTIDDARTNATSLGQGDFILSSNASSEDTAGANVTVELPDGVTLASVDDQNPELLLANSIVDTSDGVYDIVLMGNGAADDSVNNFEGMTFKSGDDIQFNQPGTRYNLNNCELELASSTNADIMKCTVDGININIANSDIIFNDRLQYFSIQGGASVVLDNVNITNIDAVNEQAANLVNIGGVGGATLLVKNTDLTSLPNFKADKRLIAPIDKNRDIVEIDFIRCVLDPDNINDQPSFAQRGSRIDCYSCDTGSGYHYFDYRRYTGIVKESTTIWRTAGDIYDKDISTTHFSAEYQPNSNVILFTNPLSPKPIKTLKLDLSGGDVVLTVELLQQNASAAPTKLTHGNVQLRAVFPDTTDTALGVTVSSGDQETTPIDVLNAGSADDLDDSTETWGGTGILATEKLTRQKISVTVPQNTETGMDKAVVELWLDVSVDLDAVSAELFVDTLPAKS